MFDLFFLYILQINHIFTKKPVGICYVNPNNFAITDNDRIAMISKHFFLTVILSACVTVLQAQFRHPGCLHSQTDFDRIEAQINSRENEIINRAWQQFSTNWMLEKEDSWMQSSIPGEYLDRGGTVNNFAHSERDFGMCYVKAIYWKLRHNSPNAAERELAKIRADQAVNLLNRYACQIKGITGNSNYALLTGFQGWQVANAAEILREYEGWKATDYKRFKQWLFDVWIDSAYDFLYRQNGQCNSHYQSNWNTAAITSMQALAIFLDEPFYYCYAMQHIKQGSTNASLADGVIGTASEGTDFQGFLPYIYDIEEYNAAHGTHYQAPLGVLCQNQENTRDQGHSQGALGTQMQTCEQAWNQGDNLWDFNNRVMAGAIEYTAGFLSASDSAFMKNYPQGPWKSDCANNGRGSYQPELSYVSRENKEVIFQIGYNHFANRMGLNMPYAKLQHKAVAATNEYNVEHGTGAGAYQNYSDVAGFGDLMHNEDSAIILPTLLTGHIQMVCGSNRTVRLTGTTYSAVEQTREGEISPFPEMSCITSGSVVKLLPTIVDGSTDTGLWEWEDNPAIVTREREIVIDTTKILRVHYTNAKGGRSTQLFVLHREGDGMMPTTTPYSKVGDVYSETPTICRASSGQTVSLGITTKVGLFRSFKWERRKKSSDEWTAAGTGVEVVVSNINDSWTYRLTATSLSGAVKVIDYHIRLSECEGYIMDGDSILQTETMAVKVGTDVVLKATPTSYLAKMKTNTERYYKWIVDGDTVRNVVLTGEDISDSLAIADITANVHCRLAFTYVRTTTGIRYSDTIDFHIETYDYDVLPTGYYYVEDTHTGKRLSSSSLMFEAPSQDADFIWCLRYIKQPKTNAYIISPQRQLGQAIDAGFELSKPQKSHLLHVYSNTTDKTKVAILNSELATCWDINEESQELEKGRSYVATFPFRLVKANGELPDATEEPHIETLIANNDFSKASAAWQGTAFTNANGDVAEQFSKTFDFYQIIEGLPDGEYELGVQAFYREGSVNDAISCYLSNSEHRYARLYANNRLASIRSIYSEDYYSRSPYTYPDNASAANEAFNEYGLYHNTLRFTLKGGTLKLGIRKHTHVANDWCCFDNFTLTYLGEWPSDDIEHVEVDNLSSPAPIIHDLSGRRLGFNKEMLDKGIYIINNKKILVR